MLSVSLFRICRAATLSARTLEEAMRNLKEASVIWVKGEREAGRPIPPPSDLSALKKHEEYAHQTWTEINIDTQGPEEVIAGI